MSRPAGIPLLSGRPPPRTGPTASGCRKCGKEFSILFNRRRECMHCGYDYCSSCTDYQALLPRRGPAHGYDSVPVCAFCVDMLNVTALGRAQLRSLPLAKLRRYIGAYNIPVKNPIDKNDLVDAAMAARTSQGCLSLVNEEYYRKHSVPSSSTPGSSSSASRSSSARAFPGTNANSNSRSNRPFPRPDLDPNRPQRPQEASQTTHTPRTPPNARRPRTASAPLNPGAARPTSRQPNVSRPTSSSGPQSTPHSTSTAHPPSHPHTAPPLPPPMSTLVTLPRSSLSSLSVGVLKQILWEARVRVPPGVVEKEELVERVWALVEEEKRKDNEGIEDGGFDGDEDEIEEPDREEEVVLEMVDPELDARSDVGHAHAQRNNPHHGTGDEVGYGRVHVESDSEATHEEHLSSLPTGFGLSSSRPTTPQPSTSPPRPPASPSHPASKSRPQPHSKLATAERSGLCVVCQDEEACIAIVDCGHLALCRACSELILSSSRECPLCRTRIVTEARLLRIFKT